MQPRSDGAEPGSYSGGPAPASGKADFQKKLLDVPHRPGVYLMRDRLRRVIYVGKARDLRKRVGSYFQPSREMRADPKTLALLETVWDFEWHSVRSEPEALLLEGRLIKEFRPKYNVSFRDDKRFLLVRVDEAEEWPRFRLTRMRKEDGARYFGPFAHAGALRQTLTFLRKRFGVMTFGRGAPSERERRSSTYQVPMKLAEVTPEQYRERVSAACEFLAGESREAMARLEEEMKSAAAALDFERAAELRNLIDSLKKTTRPTRRFERAKLPSASDPAADLAALAEALGLPAPPSLMECFDISNISATHVVASMVAFRDGIPDRRNYRKFRIKGVDGQNDFASMAEVVRRRYSGVLREATARAGDEAAITQEAPAEYLARAGAALGVKLPDLVIVDGGRGQLGMAARELQRLGLRDMPVVGLAKEFEEIYRPANPLPLRLPEGSGALHLLQRIRDEAHRVANGYHQLLLKRRVSESVLDEIPGVSATRKASLLQRFGSVARLRRASPADIATVEGISPKMAEAIAARLARR